jgi:hypothetical protein
VQDISHLTSIRLSIPAYLHLSMLHFRFPHRDEQNSEGRRAMVDSPSDALARKRILIWMKLTARKHQNLYMLTLLNLKCGARDDGSCWVLARRKGRFRLRDRSATISSRARVFSMSAFTLRNRRIPVLDLGS